MQVAFSRKAKPVPERSRKRESRQLQHLGALLLLQQDKGSETWATISLEMIPSDMGLSDIVLHQLQPLLLLAKVQQFS